MYKARALVLLAAVLCTVSAKEPDQDSCDVENKNQMEVDLDERVSYNLDFGHPNFNVYATEHQLGEGPTDRDVGCEDVLATVCTVMECIISEEVGSETEYTLYQHSGCDDDLVDELADCLDDNNLNCRACLPEYCAAADLEDDHALCNGTLDITTTELPVAAQRKLLQSSTSGGGGSKFYTYSGDDFDLDWQLSAQFEVDQRSLIKGFASVDICTDAYGSLSCHFGIAVDGDFVLASLQQHSVPDCASQNTVSFRPPKIEVSEGIHALYFAYNCPDDSDDVTIAANSLSMIGVELTDVYDTATGAFKGVCE